MAGAGAMADGAASQAGNRLALLDPPFTDSFTDARVGVSYPGQAGADIRVDHPADRERGGP